MPDSNDTPWWNRTPPLDWSLDEPRKVRDVLMHAYDERAAIKIVVTTAGLSWPTAPGGNASAKQLWTWALEAAINAGLLFETLGVVLEDRQKAALHAPLRKLVGDGIDLGYTRHLGPGGMESIADGGARLYTNHRGATGAVAALTEGGLQSINAASLGFVDARSDLAMRRDALRRTAMIQVGGVPAGTGFLVGPDLLLTAAHVLDDVHWPPEVPVEDVTAVFDFLPDERAPSETGVRVAVAEALAGSLPTVNERLGGSSDWDASATHLDFALLRLGQAMPARGFYPLETQTISLSAETVLRIPQHPLGQTQVTSPALGPFTINAPKTRLRYRANTLQGSSGSPVIDGRGRLVAMHHFAARGLNQGVLINAIAKDVEAKGITLPALQTAPDPISPGPGSTTSPFDILRFGRKPFANRDNLRQVIPEMMGPNRDRILVIQGGQDTGKSYSFRYLTHLESVPNDPVLKSFAPKGLRAIKIDLESYQNVARDKLHAKIVGDLSINMGLVPSSSLEQQARDISTLARLIDEKFNGTQKIWWLFFDSLDRDMFEHGEVDELIRQLGQLIDEKPGLPLRLVLVSREASKLPRDLVDWAEKDRANGMSRKDVEQWLDLRAKECNRPIDAKLVKDELAKLFVEGKPTLSMTELAKSLPGLLDKVLGGTP